MRLALGENGDQDIRAGHFLATGRLNVERRALNDALEAIGRLGLLLAVDNEVFEFGVEVLNDGLAQRVEVDAAGAQHGRRVDVVDQRQQQMLERRVFMTALVGEREARRRVFSSAREKIGIGRLSLLFHDALQGVLILACVIHHLRHLGLRDLVGVDAAFAYAVVVHLEHDLHRLLSVLVEECLQN